MGKKHYSISIKWKILSLAVIGGIGFFAYLTFSYNVNSENKDRLEALGNVEVQVLSHVKSIWVNVLKSKDLLTSAVGSGEMDMIKQSALRAARIEALFGEVSALAPRLAGESTSLSAEFKKYFVLGSEVSKGMILDTLDISDFQVKIPAMNRSYQDFERNFKLFDDGLRASIQEEISRANEYADQAILLGIVLGLVSSLILGVVAWFIARGVTRNINTLTDSLSAMASGSGDLNQRLEVDSHDELADLGNAFNNFLENLQGMMGELSGVALQLSKESVLIQSNSSETNRAITNLVSQTDELAATIDEINNSVAGVTTISSEVFNKATEASSKATEGHSNVSDLISNVDQNSNQISSAVDVVGTLAENANSIGAVLDIIHQIAEQTNLLALNAAIEAARAGEQGRGFAVVADEVRTLSQKTSSATDEIRTHIDTLKAESVRAMKAMDMSHSQAQQSLEKAGKADESLTEITGATSTINEISQKIAQATEMQNNLINSLAENIGQINQDAHETSARWQKSTSDSGDLSQYSMNLLAMTSRFNNKQNASSALDSMTEDVDLF